MRITPLAEQVANLEAQLLKMYENKERERNMLFGRPRESYRRLAIGEITEFYDKHVEATGEWPIGVTFHTRDKGDRGHGGLKAPVEETWDEGWGEAIGEANALFGDAFSEIDVEKEDVEKEDG